MGTSMTKIVPGLFVGSIDDACNVFQLYKTGVTHVLSVHDQPNRTFRVSNIKHMRIHLADDPSEDILQHVSVVNDFIHEARSQNGICLVHCMMGVSRSVAFCTAYLMTLLDMPFLDVIYSIIGFRTIAGPNEGFCNQLTHFQTDSLLSERNRFLSKHGIWCFELEDKAVLQKGKSNYQDFADTGEFGNRSASYDDDSNLNTLIHPMCVVSPAIEPTQSFQPSSLA